MTDLSKPIPHTEFPYGFLTVEDPSDEPLVYLDDEFECDSDYYHWKEIGGRPLPGSSPSIMARRTVRDMLHRAEDMLPEGYHFRILDAYRPIAVQQALWDHYRAQFRQEMPDLTEEELDMHTRTCVSMPSYDVLQPSIHNTGGAVDLTIIGPDGEPLDMGTTFDAFSDATWTDYFEPGQGHDKSIDNTANTAVITNRRMLYNAMTAAGFTNLPSEWWHYDYGDNMWAQLTGGKAIYAGILDADVRGKGDFRYKLILGIFILAFLMGIAGVIYFGMNYSEDKMLFWLFLIWSVFFGVTIYGWTDEDRYAKYEYYMIPVVFGAVFLLIIALFIAGLVINLPKIMTGEDVLTNLLAAIIAEASLAAFAYFTYRFFLKEYIDKLLHR